MGEKHVVIIVGALPILQGVVFFTQEVEKL